MIGTVNIALLALAQSQRAEILFESYRNLVPESELRAMQAIAFKLTGPKMRGYICWSKTAFEYEIAAGTFQLVKTLEQKPEYAKNLSLADYAVLNTQLTRYAPLYPLLSEKSDLPSLQTSLWNSYQTAYHPTPTPELTNTPDHHWAKISLDNLYRYQIFIGDPTP